jgi:hypothetical protein
MAGFYINHNTGIGLRCFAFGLFFGIGGLFAVVFNAASLGTTFGHMARVPQSENFYEFVTAHSPFEFTAIVLSAAAGMRLGFSVVQTNGLTLCRTIADNLPEGYLTKLPDGSLYGEALLAPSVIYVAFVRECIKRSIKLNYVAHVTGHGWRKLMRLDEPFVYRIDTPRPAPALFEFLMQAGPIERKEAYATYNMGVGFAAYVSPEKTDETVEAARAAGYDAWVAGTVCKEGDRKAVVVPDLDLEFEGDSLKLR